MSLAPSPRRSTPGRRKVLSHAMDGSPVPVPAHISPDRLVHSYRISVSRLASEVQGERTSNPSSRRSRLVHSRRPEKSHRALDAFKHLVEDMIHDVESKAVPLMEGGMVKVLPMISADGSLMSETENARRSKSEAQATGHGRMERYGGERWRQKSLIITITITQRLDTAGPLDAG